MKYSLSMLINPLFRKNKLALLSVGIVVIFFGISITAYAFNNASLTLSGTNSEYVFIPSPDGLPIGSAARTVEAWVKTSSTSAQTFVYYGSDSGSYHEWVAQLQDDRLAIRIGGANVYWTANDITDGNWHHVAIVYSGSGALAANTVAYMDGAQLSQYSTVDGTPDTADTALFIGASSVSPSASHFFEGNIDEVRIWNTALSSTTIAANDNVELVGNESGLVGYWKFNYDLDDATSNNNDLRSFLFSSSVPF